MLIGDQAFLRPPNPEDLLLLQEWLNSARAMGPLLGVKLRSGRDLEKQFEEDGFLGPDRGTLILGDAKKDALGFCHWWSPVPGEEVREVALFIVDPVNRRRGLGTRALLLLVHYLFSSQPIERVQALFPARLEEAERLAAKVGMTREGTLRRSAFVSGRWEDQAMWSLLRAEWEENGAYASLRTLFADPPASPFLGSVGFNGTP